MLSISYIQPKVKSLLNIDDTDLYDSRLKLLIGGAIAKLETEGIPNYFMETEDDYWGSVYIILISYTCALNLDLDVDLNSIWTQYTTMANELRCYLRRLQS